MGHDSAARSRAGPADQRGGSGAVRRAGPAHGARTARRNGRRRGAWPSTCIPDRIEPICRRPPAEPALDGVELARRISAPLLEDLRITAKVSQNLHAELALRAVGRARRNVGSFEAGMAEMKSFLAEAGIDAGGYNLMDGSGLSRLDLVTPSTVMKLLRYMYASPLREKWISILPVAAQDGTLSSRFGSTPAAGKAFAKTGLTLPRQCAFRLPAAARRRLGGLLDPGE